MVNIPQGPLVNPMAETLHRLELVANMQLSASRLSAAASLASGLMAASGRPHSIKEAKELMNSVYGTLFTDQRGSRAKLTEEEISADHV